MKTLGEIPFHNCYRMSQMLNFCFLARLNMQTNEPTTKLYPKNIVIAIMTVSQAVFVIILIVEIVIS